MRLGSLLLLLLALLALPVAAPAAAAPERRIALVIGNARYATVPLNNPENDARLVSAQLRKLGFEVTEKLNLGVRDFRRVLRDYARQVQDERGVSVLYYAGHGVQIDGRNYLLPVDINLRDEEEVKDESVDVDELFLSRIEKSGAAARIVILDACRDNPFGARTRNIRAGGLAEMAARGALIAYSSAPGAAAEDGPTGSNSVYTRHLADEIMKEGIEVEQMFKNVRVKVLRDTNERQVPWVNTSLTVNFSFNPSQAQPAAAIDDTAQRARIARLEAELDQTRRALEAARISAVVESAPPGAGPQIAGGAPADAGSAPSSAVAAAAPPANASTNRLEAELERARKALEEARAAPPKAGPARPRNEAYARPAAADTGIPDDRRRGPRDPSPRCLDLLQRSSIGDTLTADDETYLMRECK